MALFTVDIEKRLGSEFWSNRYIVQATALSAVVPIANAIVTLENTIHATIVTITRYRISSLLPNTDEYSIIPVNDPGDRAAGGTILPLFNTLRVDMPAQTGRPSRKYYRGVLGESDINGDAVTANFDTFALDLLDLFATGPEENGIVDPQGQILTNSLVYPFVQMRQLRRSRRRRTNGGGIFQ